MTQNTKISKVKIGLGIGCLIAVIAVLLSVYSAFGAKTTDGSKNITIEVINKADESVVYEVSTDAEFLKQAMDEADGLTYEAADGMVMTVNGETADYSVDASYWSFYVNDGYCNYGIDKQPIADGDVFKIEYTNN